MSAGRLFVSLYCASGAAALVYEVTWTRLLTLQLGHTVAAASTVLAAFMGGLAVGAWLAGHLAARAGNGGQMRLYAALEMVIAGAALVLPFALNATVPALAWAYADGTAPGRFAFVRVAISLMLLGIPAAAMGATFPIAADWLSRRGRAPFAAGDGGTLYAANTAGAAMGAIAAGFWLIPALGLRATTWVGVALNVIAAGGALWIGRQDPVHNDHRRAREGRRENLKEKKKVFSAIFASSAVKRRDTAAGPGVGRGRDIGFRRPRI